MQETIFLYGPPGVGKTTLGIELAKHFKIPFIDLDEEIINRSGKSIPQIFEANGKTHFRALEKRVLLNLSQQRHCIIALGGGSLLDEENHIAVSKTGTVICLMSTLETLNERISQKKTGRPLLDAQPADNLKKLYDQRKNHYCSFQKTINVDGKTLADLIWELQILLGDFIISGMERNYEVFIKENGLRQLQYHAPSLGLNPPFFLIMDSNVASHYLPLLSTIEQTLKASITPHIFPAGEDSKNMQTIQGIWDAMLDANMDRGGTVFALGGGVTGDMAGFAAATFMRGISWVNIPTSLLAMVDASLGGKTGVDLQQGKNLVGAFHPPKFVLIDPMFIKSLPEDEFNNGMAEVIKHAVVGDRELFQEIGEGKSCLKNKLHHLISRAVAVKARIIVEDPYEQGIRESLNFGHTIGHAVEKFLDYQIGHGSAVSIGMVLETWLAEQIGLAPEGLSDKIKSLLSLYGLPYSLPPEIDLSGLITAMQLDKKKRQDKIYFSLPEEIGRVKTKTYIPNLEELLIKKLESG